MSRVLALAGLALAACGSTGGDLVTFHASAVGPDDAVAGQPYSFSNSVGYSVTLTRAHLQVGPIYLKQAVATFSDPAQPCVSQDQLYVGQVLTSVNVDALSPALQPLGDGDGTTTQGHSAELWFATDIDAPDSQVVVLDFAGTASKAGVDYPFSGSVTIGANRRVATENQALPSKYPICRQRIVSPLTADIQPSQGGRLTLHIAPREWFTSVDFSALDPDPNQPGAYLFADQTEGPPNVALWSGLHSVSAFSLSWTDQ